MLDSKVLSDLIFFVVVIIVIAGFYKVIKNSCSLEMEEGVSRGVVPKDIHDEDVLDHETHEAAIRHVREEKIALCEKADESGEDVCWDCLSIKPDRCRCGKCLECYGYMGGIDCTACSTNT